MEGNGKMGGYLAADMVLQTLIYCGGGDIEQRSLRIINFFDILFFQSCYTLTTSL